jgi:hypothetical protein
MIFMFLLSCGDVEEVDPVLPEEAASISKTLRQWRVGYETEDVEMYMNVYWKAGFLYVSDLGTETDKTDDVVFDNWEQERESAIRVFERFQDLELELSEPPEINFLDDVHTKAEVRNHYRIQGFVASGESLDGGYTGWFAEGDNRFIFELRTNQDTAKKEWRILEWHDEAFSEEEIRVANSL